MHGNQLRKIVPILKDQDMQIVFSILEDKLPEEMKKNEYIILALEPSDKLFRF